MATTLTSTSIEKNDVGDLNNVLTTRSLKKRGNPHSSLICNAIVFRCHCPPLAPGRPPHNRKIREKTISDIKGQTITEKSRPQQTTSSWTPITSQDTVLDKHPKSMIVSYVAINLKYKSSRTPHITSFWRRTNYCFTSTTSSVNNDDDATSTTLLFRSVLDH